VPLVACPPVHRVNIKGATHWWASHQWHTGMNLDATQRKKLIALLDELAGAVEDVLQTGLTAASKSSIDSIFITFREAPRMRLLRLGATLRVVTEQIRRYTDDSTMFSPAQFALFLNRTWLLSRAMGRALREKDDARFAELNATPPARKVERVEVVTLGVNKRVIQDVVNIFEFRLRVTADGDGLKRGDALQWSCIFPAKPGANLPPEAYLQLPQKLKQKEKFWPARLLEGDAYVFGNVMIRDAGDGQTPMLMLGEDTTVEPAPGNKFDDWNSLVTWDADAARERLREHTPGPLDLEVELMEEVILDADTWTIAAKPSHEEDHHALYPVVLGNTGVELHARVPTTADAKPLRDTLKKLAKAKTRPPLFGLVHYESCRLVLQPIATITPDGPDYITLNKDKISKGELVKALKFDL